MNDLDKLEKKIFDYIETCDFEESLLSAVKELKAARNIVEHARAIYEGKLLYPTAGLWGELFLKYDEARRG